MTFLLGMLLASLHLITLQDYSSQPWEWIDSGVIAEPAEKVEDFAGIFRDFVFVGSTPLDDPVIIPSHSLKESRPLPQMFDVGRSYFFHLPAYEGKSFFIDAFYYAVLRDRLRAQGMLTNFIFLPNGMPVSMLNRVADQEYTEYPVAEVRFWGKGYAGKVTLIPHVRKDAQFIARRHIHDYVLVIEKQPVPESD